MNLGHVSLSDPQSVIRTLRMLVDEAQVRARLWSGINPPKARGMGVGRGRPLERK